MDKNDVATVSGRMVEAVRAFVSRAEIALAKRIAAAEVQIAAIPAGPKGEAGERGDAGESIRGEQGPSGNDGTSVHPDTVALLVRDAVVAAMGAVPAGPKGDTGARGETGIAIDGKDGDAGRDGRDGKDGVDGRDGKDGASGRDAAELDVLPSIDEARSYQRGTWASWNGGLIRAGRQTDAVRDGTITDAGWAVMVEGVAALVVTQGDDPRELTVGSMLTSGAKATAQFRVPMLLYHGVWREGEFERGDVTTWAGSSWHCEKTTSDKPSTSDAWKLMVKRGQDGKDADGGGSAPSGVARLK